MLRSIIRLTLAIVSTLVVCQPVWSQIDNDVAYWLDRDTTLVLNVQDVPETYRRIKSLDLFRNPRFLKAIDMMSDERFPLIDTANHELAAERLLSLESMVRETEQLSLVVHQIDESVFRWSLFLRATPNHLDMIQAELMGLGDQYRALQEAVAEKFKAARKGEFGMMGGLPGMGGLELMGGKQEQPDLVESAPDEPDVSETIPDDDSITVGQFTLKRMGEWLVLSNDLNFVKQLSGRVDDEKFRSLGKSRKYQGIIRRESSLNRSTGRISVYGNPYRMRYLIPYRTQSGWELSEVDEMPSCGFNFVITDPDPEVAKESRPIILADATIKFTKPTIGLAKMYEHYEPIEIPRLAVEPTEFSGFARDDDAICVESGRVYDLRYGEGSSKSWWTGHFKDTGMDQFTDAVHRRSAFFEMRFVDGENYSVERPGLISLEKVKDADAMFRYADGVARLAIHRHGRELGFDDDGSIVRWISKESDFGKSSGLDGFARDNYSRADFYNCFHDAYVLTDQWWVQGDMPAVENQVALLNQEVGEDFRFVLQDLIDDLSMRIGAGSQAYMIKYFTESSWMENLNNIEEAYASNSSSLSVPISWDYGEVIRDYGEAIKADASLPSSGSTIELQSSVQMLKLLSGPEQQPDVQSKRPDSNEEAEQASPQMRIAAMGIQIASEELQQMGIVGTSGKQLGKRNEDGYRIQIENQEDLKAAIKIMILKSFSESFPRQVFLYSKTDDYLQITMGVYPLLNSEVEEAAEVEEKEKDAEAVNDAEESDGDP